MATPQTEILDVKKLIGVVLVDNLRTLRTAYNDSFTLEWEDDDEYAKKNSPGQSSPVETPYGTFRMGNPIPGRTVKNYKRERRLLDDTDTFTYTGAETFNMEKIDVDSIVSVTGTAGGAPRTFVQGTDYEHTSTPPYDTQGIIKNALRWLAGGVKPDNGTVVTVNLKYLVIDEYAAKFSSLTTRLILHAGDIDAARKTALGLSRTYVKSRLIDQLYEHLQAQLSLLQGRDLTATQGALVLKDIIEINQYRTDHAESIARRAIDIRLTRRQTIYKQTVNRIGVIETSTTAE